MFRSGKHGGYLVDSVFLVQYKDICHCSSSYISYRIIQLEGCSIGAFIYKFLILSFCMIS